MNAHFSASMVTACVLGALAGTVSSVHAEPPSTGREAGSMASSVDFRSCKWLGERKVMNSNSEQVAVVSDLILDRGSGRIEYLIIKTGTTLGMGGRAIAIPFGQFQWTPDGESEAFVLAATPEQLKLHPEYTPERWNALRDTSSDEACALRQRLIDDAAAVDDPYDAALDTAGSRRITGEVKSVERVKTTSGERVVIDVLTTDGATRRIALGPSWYVNSSAAAPMRGDKVVIDALSLPRDPDQLMAGTHLKNGDRELPLRGNKGAPVWGLKTKQAGERAQSSPHSRYLLMSTLPGMKIDCRGNECGKVQDVIIDRHSGEIGFLSIDPNQNFLGIGDTKRLIPWSVATVTTDGVVRLDASKQMILESPQTPADLSTLNAGSHAERVYEAYDVPCPKFLSSKR
jgi:sporulation protein YlmC with PRC-barrel domain